MICIGKYGDIPKIPMFPCKRGPEIFNGKVLHTLDYCNLHQQAANQLLSNKKVVVVGFKKSALDLAMECAQANQGNITLQFNSFLLRFASINICYLS